MCTTIKTCDQGNLCYMLHHGNQIGTEKWTSIGLNAPKA